MSIVYIELNKTISNEKGKKGKEKVSEMIWYWDKLLNKYI